MGRISTTAVILSLLCFTNPALASEQAGSLAEAFSGGKAGVSFRYRLENVDQDGFREDALASTLRSRLHYRTLDYLGTSLVLEVEDVSHLGNDRFNSTRNTRVMYPVVADPSGTGVNQFYLTFKPEGFNWQSQIGRQRINRDNQRFIGGVGWRQNEQTYDAVDVQWHDDSASIGYTYVDGVARIFGPDTGTPAASLESDSHLLNGLVSFGPAGDLAAYAYFLDFENATSVSNRTVGLRYAVKPSADGMVFPLVLEFANQRDYGDNPADYSVNYRLFEAGISAGRGTFTVGNEILEGSATGAFVTPLATLHKFQGWADKFLATPGGGIDDRYIAARTRLGTFNLVASYHRFQSETDGTDYGSELDLSLGCSLGEHVQLLVKAASYEADTHSSDTTKLWLMLSASF